MYVIYGLPVIITATGVYSLQGYPRYLLPFFCLQVFDFVVTSLSVIGYFSYAPNIRLWIMKQVSYRHDNIVSISDVVTCRCVFIINPQFWVWFEYKVCVVYRWPSSTAGFLPGSHSLYITDARLTDSS